MTEFKVGDKIRVYSATLKPYTYIIEPGDISGDTIFTAPPIGHFVMVHKKQCRRLKPKRVARTVWVIVDEKCIYNAFAYKSEQEAKIQWPSGRYKAVEYREILKK